MPDPDAIPDGPAEKPVSQADEPEVDWFLQSLVHLANSNGLSFGVTLMVNGTIISGRLVSSPEYFENFGNEIEHSITFADAAGQDATAAAKSIGDSFRAIGTAQKEAMEKEPDSLPSFINLRDALIIHPGAPAIPGNRRVWWRGRLSSIGGFILGTLDPPTE